MRATYPTYTLWVKYSNTGWIPLITAKDTNNQWSTSPYGLLVDYATRRFEIHNYWKRGKNWMVKPEGQKPAGLLAKGC